MVLNNEYVIDRVRDTDTVTDSETATVTDFPEGSGVAGGISLVRDGGAGSSLDGVNSLDAVNESIGVRVLMINVGTLMLLLGPYGVATVRQSGVAGGTLIAHGVLSGSETSNSVGKACVTLCKTCVAVTRSLTDGGTYWLTPYAATIPDGS
jgi:hypothetical protein